MKTKKEKKKKNPKKDPQGESPFRVKNPGVYSNLEPAAVFRKGGIVTAVPTCVGWDTVRYLQLYICVNATVPDLVGWLLGSRD